MFYLHLRCLLFKNFSSRGFGPVVYNREFIRARDKLGKKFKFKIFQMSIFNGSKNFDLFYRFNKFQFH